MAAVTELASAVGASAACQALCMPRASYYRDRRKTSFPEDTVSRPLPARALRRNANRSWLVCTKNLWMLIYSGFFSNPTYRDLGEVVIYNSCAANKK